MLDKKATMVLPLQRRAKLTENPVLLAQDQSQTCSGPLDKREESEPQPRPIPAPGFPGNAEQEVFVTTNPSSCSITSCPQGLSHDPRAGLGLLLLGLKAYFGHSPASLESDKSHLGLLV